MRPALLRPLAVLEGARRTFRQGPVEKTANYWVRRDLMKNPCSLQWAPDAYRELLDSAPIPYKTLKE